MQTLISIIIPTYNNEKYLAKTLESVLYQTSSNWECLLVDDGSNDATIKITTSFCDGDRRFSSFKRPSYVLKGANACRNIGIEKSRGSHLMFLDADDLLALTCIENRLNQIDYKSDFYVFPMGVITKSDFSNVKIANRYAMVNQSYLTMFLSYQTPWPITSLLIRKAALSIRFSEKLHRFQDVDFSIRLLLDNNEENLQIHRGEPDCYYLKDENNLKKFRNPAFISKVVSSFFIFIEDLLPLLKNKLDQSQIKLLARFYNRIFNSYVIGNGSFLGNKPRYIEQMLYDNHIITRKEKLLYYLKSKPYISRLICLKNSLK